MLLLNLPNKQMIQERKASPEPFQLQVDHPNDGACQFETYRGKTCGEICGNPATTTVPSVCSIDCKKI